MCDNVLYPIYNTDADRSGVDSIGDNLAAGWIDIGPSVKLASGKVYLWLHVISAGNQLS